MEAADGVYEECVREEGVKSVMMIVEGVCDAILVMFCKTKGVLYERLVPPIAYHVIPRESLL